VTLSVLAAVGWKVIDRFHIAGRLAISPHGVGIAIGFLAGAYVFMEESRRRGYAEEASSAIVFWALIGTVIGSRLGYVFTHLSEFHNPVAILQVYKGGLSQLGGVVGAVAVCFVSIRHRGLSFAKGLDAAAIPIPLGVVIGRVGDLIIGDHLGKPTSWALAFHYHGGTLAGYDCTGNICTTFLSGNHVQVISEHGAELHAQGPFGPVIQQGIGVHQTALYDFLLTMGLVLLLVWMNRKDRRDSVLFLTYMIWYGTGRIITDFLRVENRFFGLTGSQWTSSVAVAVAAGLLVWYIRHPGGPKPWGPYHHLVDEDGLPYRGAAEGEASPPEPASEATEP
jgi:phosphatidylglycerol:prolipoprotein diacylglycerol transferase